MYYIRQSYTGGDVRKSAHSILINMSIWGDLDTIWSVYRNDTN